MLLLTMVVWIYMYIRRIAFIQNSELTPGTITAAELARLSPPAVSNPSDNLKNLFEIPVLFYALTIYLFVTGEVDSTYVAASWVFVGGRCLHSAIHCTLNVVMVRFSIYALSTLALWFMCLRAAIHHVGF